MEERHEQMITRRAATGVIALTALAGVARSGWGVRMKPEYRVSLAEWSLHRPLHAGEITNLDFPREARAMGFEAVEYVNQFFVDKARDDTYLKDLKDRCDGEGVESLLIMVDGMGRLGAPDEGERTRAVDAHVQWLEAAKALGCHSIRVNAASEGPWEEQEQLAADGLRALCERAEPFRLNVIVENHGGATSNGAWLARTIKLVDHPLAGTLPDFGNFCYDWSKSDDPAQWYDRYQGVAELMPYAKAVSAKSYRFDSRGDETTIDYLRMMRIVVDSGYSGWVGVEYEGDLDDPREGCVATKRLLERIRDELSSD